MENSREYKSRDFYQSCVLKTAGIPLTRLEKDGTQFVFVFEDKENKAEEILRRYWSRKIKLEARDLIENIHELKTRIYSGI